MNKVKNYWWILLFVFSYPTSAQSLQRTSIGKSGVSISSYCKMTFDVSQSRDSSTVYNSECVQNGVTYGVICIKLRKVRTDLNEAETLTSAYLDYLRSSFNITHADGYQKGLRLNNDSRATGISDNWSNAEQTQWKVKAWTNGRFITVLYVSSKAPIVAASSDAYLGSVKFQ